MAVETAENAEADAGAHGGGCACGSCPHSVRAGRRRAAAEFAARRDELAAGQGVPAALAHSDGASRQWVSDELTQAARALAGRAHAERDAWHCLVRRRTVFAVWGGCAALLLGQALTAIGAGWTAARTAGIVAAVATAALLTLAARLHHSRGGLLAPVVGADNRLSTSRAVAAVWLLFVLFAVLLIAVETAVSPAGAGRRELLAGFRLGRSAGVLTVLALTCAVAVLVRRVVALRVRTQRLQKIRADRPRAADLLTDDAGRGSFGDVQYALVCAVVVVLAAVRLARRPQQLPDIPWGLAVLMAVSAAVYVAGKYAEGGRPVILSVVRAREAGDLDGPIRTGDDIEIRGAGFLPPGARTPDRLARMVVRIGAVYVHVPLVPAPGGFTNPTDAALTVPIPVDVEPGPAEVQVITAAGAETNRYQITVCD
ncbi:hypothetical protein AB0I49_10105 [Streptomyces sp. NPDC050617]|uniref:hypothetical protein n=1 Tax=Streptomyces sp. NPDC050617 TaxID=3154628 RepID=UPI00343CEBD9